MSLSFNQTDDNNNKDLSQLLGAKHEAGQVQSQPFPSIETMFAALCPRCNMLLPLALVCHAGLDDIQGGFILAEVIWHVPIRVDSKQVSPTAERGSE